MAGALAGIKVLEFATHLPGPGAAALLGDLGADVIKIEEPPGGDPIRYRGGDQRGYSERFTTQNRNKRSLLLNLKSPGARPILTRLLATADVAIVSMRPSARARLGLDYAQLAPSHPLLVYCAISGFGDTEIGRNEAGYDLTAQARAGLLDLAGGQSDRPIGAGLFLADQLTAIFACQGVLAALVARGRTGRGQQVETSLLRASVALTEHAVGQGFKSALVESDPYIFRPGSFRATAADGREFAVYIGSAAPPWIAFTDAMNCPDLRDDPRFINARSRGENAEGLNQIILDRAKHQPRDYWLARLEQADVPVAPVNRMDEVASDPFVAQLNMFGTVLDPWDETRPVVGPGVALGGTPAEAARRPPLPGEHGREILLEHKFSAADIEMFERDGVFRDKP